MIAFETALLDQSPMILGATALVTLLVAWRFGRAPERFLASLLLALVVSDLLLGMSYSGRAAYDRFRIGIALRDALVLVGVGAAALRANRLYPLVMAGAAMVAALAHLMRWLELFQGPFSYLVLTTAPGFVIVAAFLTGLALHIRRERLSGPYPAWRETALPPAFAATDKIGQPDA